MLIIATNGCTLRSEPTMNTALIIANVLAAAAFISLFF